MKIKPLITTNQIIASLLAFVLLIGVEDNKWITIAILVWIIVIMEQLK